MIDIKLELVKSKLQSVSKLIKLITFSSDVSEGTVIEVSELADGMNLIQKELEEICHELDQIIENQKETE
ncbi:hypothetical protein [Anaerorhabdus furcosa]|uniref:Uncharacterized protein n=1 Tax=Anaerorhabdus furcosa TaxID=118967 RepID=A0A1T4K447_9FIRM|nr:hypothetical protein [Anaerorhabdus furcosa]SJZ37191.1 hypothetical protein SAMN02745191_0294 [Anaerorhabdus furcosa]